MNVLTPTTNPSHLDEEASAAMCLLSMKTLSASSSDSSVAFPAEHNSNTIQLNQHALHDTNQLLPMSLFTPRDPDFLSPLQCYIRKNCIEFFAADVSESGYVAKGRQTPITSGRVGIRCRFCKHATKRATQSTSFPKQIDKIYSAASMIQCRHFPNCHLIPKGVKNKLARLKKQGNGSVNMRQYWADVAREKGFVDTDEDIRFSPTLSSPMEDVEYTSSDDDSSMEDLSPACPRVVTPVDFPFENNNDSPLSLVRTEDKGLVSDHVFFAFAQMTGVTLTSDDKAGPWKDRMCGEKGLTCRHCQGRVLIKGKPSGRWFPTSATNLGQTTTMNSIVKHAKNCPHAPTEVKNAMASLLMCNDSTEVQQKKKYGSRKTFFSRVFQRMMAHEEPQPPLQSHVHLFSPIIVQSDEDDDDFVFVPAGSKRNRASSASDGATRKRRG